MKYCVIKHLILLQNPKYDGYQRGLASMVYKIFDKKSASLGDEVASGRAIKMRIFQTKT